MQILDGFLAVLNIVGGSFSPPTQKLPFAVTSIDEDSSLLYYSSIDLAGRSSTSTANFNSPKLRNLSNNDSRSAKSRLRIPVKGRIQLVLVFFNLSLWLCLFLCSSLPIPLRCQALHLRYLVLLYSNENTYMRNLI
jgi:hypothetical protein